MQKHTLSHEDIASLETTQLEEATGGGFSVRPDSLLNGIPAPGGLHGLGDVVDRGGFPFGIIRNPVDFSF